MINNLGKFAHPKRKMSPVTGPKQTSFQKAPGSKPDPVSMTVNDVGMASATPGTGAMPKGSVPSANLATRGAGQGMAKKPSVKTIKSGTGLSRAKKPTPFFGM